MGSRNVVGRTQIELIENRGPNTLLLTFRKLLTELGVVDAQVAFVSAEGVGIVLPYLRKAAARGKVRIVTGLYQAVTEPSALRLLLTAQRQTKGRLEARLARDLRFHRKLYLMRNGNACYVISGSSNLTAEGLRGGGEFNLLARLPIMGPAARRLVAEFDRLWTTGTVPLSLERIRRYEILRPRRPRPAVSARSLALVLGSASSNGAGNGAASLGIVPRYWRDWISGFARQRTEAVVSEETDWDRKGYWWYSSHGDVFERGDRILLFDRANGWAEVVVVKDTTRTATPTPDGRHFVAYQRVRGRRRRRLAKGLWKMLANVGMAMSSDARIRRRRLTDGQWGRIASVFHK